METCTIKSTEVKYVALSDAGEIIMWQRKLPHELREK